MSSTTFPILVRCLYDSQTSTTRLQVIRIDTSESVRLGDNSFLLRILVDQVTSVVRCSIHHIASGREAYVQGGPNLVVFINDCLLNGGKPDHDDEGETEK